MGQSQLLAVVVSILVAQQTVAELDPVASGGRLPKTVVDDFVEPEPVVGLPGVSTQHADADLQELFTGTGPFVSDLGKFVHRTAQIVVAQRIVPVFPRGDVAMTAAAQVAQDSAPVEAGGPVVSAHGIGRTDDGRGRSVGQMQDRRVLRSLFGLENRWTCSHGRPSF